jgi:hypothetical protein
LKGGLKTVRRQKTNTIIVILLVLLLAIGVAYAAYGDTLTIDGSATMNGRFEVEFTGVSKIGNNVSATIQQDETRLSVSATLGFPGDGASVTPTIINRGTVNAKVTAINVYVGDSTTPFSDDDITISIPELESDVLTSNQSCNFTFTIIWDADSALTEQKTVNFDIVIEYEQDTTPFTATPGHNSHV